MNKTVLSSLHIIKTGAIKMEKSLWKDKKKLDHNYIPENLPRREEERKEIFRDLFSFYETQDSNGFTSWLIYGSVGSGKTVLSRRIGVDLTESYGDELRVIYINCRTEKKVYNVLTRMVRELEPNLPRRGFSREDLINIFTQILVESENQALLILDEIDGIFYSSEGEKANDFLYTLSRAWEQNNVGEFLKLGLIIVTRDVSALYKWLDNATRASLLKKSMKLKTYDFDDLMEILRYRAKLAIQDDAYDEETLELIAKHVSENLRGDLRGNARIAIDLLRDAGDIAMMENRLYITADDVRKAIIRNPNTEPVDDEIFASLGKQKLILLLAITRGIKSIGGAYITRAQLETFYNMVCEEYDEEPRKTTQMLRYLKEIEEETKGAINVVVTGKGQRGRSTRISLNIPAEDLERKIEQILEGGIRL